MSHNFYYNQEVMLYNPFVHVITGYNRKKFQFRQRLFHWVRAQGRRKDNQAHVRDNPVCVWLNHCNVEHEMAPVYSPIVWNQSWARLLCPHRMQIELHMVFVIGALNFCILIQH